MSSGAQDKFFYLMFTKTDTAMAVPAVVAATALYISMTVHDKISSAGSSSCATWFFTDWVSPLLPHF